MDIDRIGEGNKTILEHLEGVTEEDYKQVYSFFEFTADLLCIASFEGFFVKINPAVSKVLGYTEEELFSTHISTFVHPDDKLNTYTSRLNVVKGEPLLNFENRYITKSGGFVWLSWTSIPIPDKKLVFAIAKDVTARKKLEDEKNQLYQNIANNNKDLEHFSRIASHDLRSPINNILSLFDLLDTSTIENEETLGIIQLLKVSTQKVNQTLETYINDLVQKQSNIKNEETVNLSDVAKDVISSIDTLVKSSNTLINIDFNAFNLINFKKNYLESIFLNLITNAIKYAVTSRKPCIEISTRYHGELKQLIISDNGIGFDMENVKDRIFGLNQTFNNHSEAKGLGLYLVKTHVEEMGGKIDVESQLNEGTKFIITFAD